jgi:hypothetical protein
MLARAETAISTRNMISARSIDATLLDEFADVDSLQVIGYGDPEMTRDLVEENSTRTRIHAGGHADAYLHGTILEAQTTTKTVGTLTTDPRPGYYTFRDATIVDFTTTPDVKVGDILYIHNALSTEQELYVIDQVEANQLYVSRRSQFPRQIPLPLATYTGGEVNNVLGADLVYGHSGYTFLSTDVGRYIQITDSTFLPATDNVGTWKILAVDLGGNYATVDYPAGAFVNEAAMTWSLIEREVAGVTHTIVQYTIGDNAPGFDDKISGGVGVPLNSGRFTNEIKTTGSVFLPLVPMYDITDVSFADPGGAYGVLSVGGRVTFKTRVNTAPADPAFDPDNLEYRVVCLNPAEAQSAWQIMRLDVGYTGFPGISFDGESLRVTYDTLSGYDAVWSYMLSSDRRVVCGSVIPKGLHPVYISTNVRYSLAKTATASLDETAAGLALVNHLSTFPIGEDLDTSDISAFLRTTYGVIGYIEPPVINYTLIAPDGRLIYYTTTDKVIIDPTKHLYPTTSMYCLADPMAAGVSVRTIRFVSSASRITFELV